jgi:hypothetical protein
VTYRRYFKTVEAQRGEGDVRIGGRMGQVFAVAKSLSRCRRKRLRNSGKRDSRGESQRSEHHGQTEPRQEDVRKPQTSIVYYMNSGAKFVISETLKKPLA